MKMKPEYHFKSFSSLLHFHQFYSIFTKVDITKILGGMIWRKPPVGSAIVSNFRGDFYQLYRYSHIQTKNKWVFPQVRPTIWKGILEK